MPCFRLSTDVLSLIHCNRAFVVRVYNIHDVVARSLACQHARLWAFSTPATALSTVRHDWLALTALERARKERLTLEPSGRT
jgi:hypothetical protein